MTRDAAGPRLADHTTLRLGGPARRLVRRRDRRRPDRGRAAPPTRPASRCSCSAAAATWSSPMPASTDCRAGRDRVGYAAVRRRTRSRSRPARSGTTSSRSLVAEGYAGVEALSGIPGASAPLRSRTSGPTARRSRRPSSRCACSTGGPATSMQVTAEDVPVHLPAQRLQERRPLRGARRDVPRSAAHGSASRCATPPSPRTSASRSARRCPRPRSARRCWTSAGAKGMVLDPADHDTWSAGSFFTNPLLDAADAARLPAAAAALARARRPGQDLGGVADRAGRLPHGLRRSGARRCRPSTRSP